MADFIVDIVLVLIFVSVTFAYYKRGFVRSLMSALSWVISIVASRAISGAVITWVAANTALFQGIEPAVAHLIMYIILFMVFRMLMTAVCWLINKFFELPLLKQVNKLLGILLGTFSGLVCVVILSMCLQVSANVVYNDKYVDAVNKSAIVKAVSSCESIIANVEIVAVQQNSEV